MARNVEEFQARAEACRAAAAAARLDKVRELHLNAAARWEILANESRWSPVGGQLSGGDRLRSEQVAASRRRAIPLDAPSSEFAEGSGIVAKPSLHEARVTALRDSSGSESPVVRSWSEVTIGARTTGEPTAREQAPSPPIVSHNGRSIALLADDGGIRTLDQIEADVIRLALAIYQGRISEVARRLGIGRSTLYRKLEELGIAAPR